MKDKSHTAIPILACDIEAISKSIFFNNGIKGSIMISCAAIAKGQHWVVASLLRKSINFDEV